MKIPGYLPLLTMLTGAYLVFELAFNARLLDVTGSIASASEIDSIQWWGRMISGLALALGICGMQLMPMAARLQWSLPKQVYFLAVAATASVSAAYFSEKAFIDYVSENTSGKARNVAAHLGLLAQGILTHNVKLDGIDLDQDELASPEGKSFVALLPLEAFSTAEVGQKFQDALPKIILNFVLDEVGSSGHYYNDVFIPSARQMSESYNQYATASNNLEQALSDIPARQREAWAQHTQYSFGAPMVARGIWRRRYVNVARGPSKSSVYESISHQIETTAWSAYNSGIEQELGPGVRIPKGLRIDAFIAQPAVQAKWRSELQIDKATTLTLKESVTDVTAAVYEPMIDRLVKHRLADYQAEDAALANGGRLEEAGKNAMRALLVPPIALALSLAGALVHITKFIDCLCGFLPGPKWPKRLTILVTVAAAISMVFAAPNEVSTSRVFLYFKQKTAEKFGPVLELAMTWVVQAQPYAYPVNELVREHLPGPPTFGYLHDVRRAEFKLDPPITLATRDN